MTAQTQDGQTTSFIWNPQNYLMQEIAPDGSSESYAYCGEGIRRTVTNSAGLRCFIRDGKNILLEADVSNNTLRRYTHMGEMWGELISLHEGNASRYYGFDGSANTRVLTDESGGVSDAYLYSAFGEELQVSGNSANPLRFGGEVGYYRDDAERVYVRARHLDVGDGRWMSRDPIGFEGEDWNLYGYVGNNPTNRIDPSGLFVPAASVAPPAAVAATGGGTGVGGGAATAAGIGVGWFLAGLVVIAGVSYLTYKTVDGKLVRYYQKNAPSLSAPSRVTTSKPQPTPVPTPCPRPTPDGKECTDSEYTELTRWVHAECNKPRSCKEGRNWRYSCPKLRRLHAINKECLRRRSYRDRRCKNRDPKPQTHRKERLDALEHAKKCMDKIKANCP